MNATHQSRLTTLSGTPLLRVEPVGTTFEVRLRDGEVVDGPFTSREAAESAANELVLALKDL